MESCSTHSFLLFDFFFFFFFLLPTKFESLKRAEHELGERAQLNEKLRTAPSLTAASQMMPCLLLHSSVHRAAVWMSNDGSTRLDCYWPKSTWMYTNVSCLISFVQSRHQLLLLGVSSISNVLLFISSSFYRHGNNNNNNCDIFFFFFFLFMDSLMLCSVVPLTS